MNPEKGSFFMSFFVNIIMSEIELVDCKIDKKYIISKIKICDMELKNFLLSLGFEAGVEIVVLKTNYFKKGFLIKVKQINYAIDYKLAERICVYEK